MQAFFVSIGAVALGEIGDKTQLLAILLAAKYRRPVPIILGILIATLANHAAAGALGGWIAQAMGAQVLRWTIGLSFLAMAGWMLVPDRIDSTLPSALQRLGVFGSTAVVFFLAEMGDKTQLATVALAARFGEVATVVVGTTLGMMLTNVPAVLLGEKIAQRVSIRLMHGIAAVIFMILGVWVLLDADRLL